MTSIPIVPPPTIRLAAAIGLLCFGSILPSPAQFPATVFFSQNAATVSENGAQMTFTVQLDTGAADIAEFGYTVIGGSAGGAHYGIDYVPDPVDPITGGTFLRPGLVKVTAGSTKVELRFRTVPDRLYEGQQDFIIGLTDLKFLNFSVNSPRALTRTILDSEQENTRWLARTSILPDDTTGLSVWRLNPQGLPARTIGPDLFYTLNSSRGTGRSVALANLDRNGAPEAIIGSGGGRQSAVAVFSLNSSLAIQRMAWQPYGDFAGEVNVAAGDVDGDGTDEIITGAGATGGPHVKIWKISGTTGVNWGYTLLRDFFAFDGAFTGGVRVAAGDVDGDGRADIISAMGPGSFPYVVTQSGATGQNLPGGSFFPYAIDFTGGVNVSAADLDGDGTAEIVTGAGDSGSRHLRAYQAATRQYVIDFVAPGSATGIRVAALPAPRRYGSLRRGGILTGEPSSPYFSFRTTVVDQTPAATPPTVTLGDDQAMDATAASQQWFAAYQMPEKPPYLYDFSEPTAELTLTSVAPPSIFYRFPTVPGIGYDIESSYSLESWRRDYSIGGDGTIKEFTQTIGVNAGPIGNDRQLLRLRAVNWANRPRLGSP